MGENTYQSWSDSFNVTVYCPKILWMGATRLIPWKIKCREVERKALGTVYQVQNDSVSRGSVGKSELAMELTYKSIS